MGANRRLPVAERDAALRSAWAEGARAVDLAKDYAISVPRVYQIVKGVPRPAAARRPGRRKAKPQPARKAAFDYDPADYEDVPPPPRNRKRTMNRIQSTAVLRNDPRPLGTIGQSIRTTQPLPPPPKPKRKSRRRREPPIFPERVSIQSLTAYTTELADYWEVLHRRKERQRNADGQ